MNVELEIPAQRIADLMITAIEGNDMTRAWCSGIFLRGAWEKRISELQSPWYSDPKLYEGPDCTLEICEVIDESQPPSGANVRKHRCNLADIRKGFKLMAKNSPSLFGDFLAENEDAVTADVWLQYVALGDIVYG